MPMMVVDDNEFEAELKNVTSTPEVTRDTNPISTPEVLPPEKPGRKEGDVNVPQSLRKVIAEESHINGRQEAIELAKMFGVSPSSVSAYAKGATSTDTYNKPNNSLREYINKRKDRATKKALRALHSTLDTLSGKDLDEVKAKDLASIAKDMSAIVKTFEPEGPTVDPSNGNQFIFYAPHFHQESHYGEPLRIQE